MGTLTTTGADNYSITITGSLNINADMSAIYTPQSIRDIISFNVDGADISFKGQEIIRLKQMLAQWTKQNHPEDLL